VSRRARSPTAGSSFLLISEGDPADGLTRGAAVTPGSASAQHSSPEPETAAIRLVFGAALESARRFHDLLATDGAARGLIGPREIDRLWTRHLLNCAVLTELVPDRVRVVDVGSGAGLPGIVLAIRRPDLQVDLIDSLQRRTEFLSEAVDQLGLADRVRVIHGRAEDVGTVTKAGSSQWVTARAVAPLDRLVRWCMPLLRPGGHLLAMKGASAIDEVTRHRQAVRRNGGDEIRVMELGKGVLDQPTTVVLVRRAGRARQQEGGES
jgi:16S rRNA (guanine527-N7)-methyltransferase